MTHIENILPEMVGSEVQRLLVSDADGLAAAALYALVENATGCRLPQPDGTPSSEVEELLALCSAVLRRHWQTPLTMLDGLSLQDLVSRLMADRVEGNATLGIPAVNGSVTEALSALLERKITGASEVADGMSLVQLLCGSAASASLTTLTDPTTGWTMDKAMPWANFPNLTSVELGCMKLTAWSAIPANLTELYFPHLLTLATSTNIYYNNSNITEIYVPNLYEMDNGFTYDEPRSSCFISTCANLKKVTLPNLTHYGVVDGVSISNDGMYCCLIHSCESLEEVYLPAYTGYRNWRIVRNVPALRKLVLGTISSGVPSLYGKTDYPFDSCVNLIHLEIAGAVVSLDFRSWSPTTALSDNLLQFLSNFREFLFLRLADRTGQSALTLTLSQAVYQAITGTDTTTTALMLTLNQLGITDLTDKETQAGITLNTTYATWLETYRDAINWNIGYV